MELGVTPVYDNLYIYPTQPVIVDSNTVSFRE